MSNLAQLESSGLQFTRVRDACAQLIDGGRDTVDILDSAIGGAGFALFDKNGDFTLRGIKKPDGTYPILINLGQVSSNDGGNPDRLIFTKAIVLVTKGRVKLQDFVVRGAEITAADGANGAGIRIDPAAEHVTIQNVMAIGNQNGVLSSIPIIPNQTIEFIDFIAQKNGTTGDDGKTHATYIGACAQVSYLRCELTGTTNAHDQKSRAKITISRQSLFEGSVRGRESDIPECGIVDSAHCKYIKHFDAQQNNLIEIGDDGNPDGRPEKYTYVNDWFEIDMANDGRALTIFNNNGNTEVVLTDPYIKIAGQVISDTDAMKYMAGKSPVRIVSTGGPRGPQLPVGATGDIRGPGTGNATPTATPTQAPTPGVPTPAAAPVPTPAAPAAGNWTTIAKEGDKGIPVGVGTIVRYGSQGKYVTKTTTTPSVDATNEFFGSDPLPGIGKSLDRFVTSAAPVATPTPAPMPSAAPVPATPAAAPPAPNTVPMAVTTAVPGIFTQSGSYTLDVVTDASGMKSLNITRKS